jgi:hypothetical protein
MAVGLVRLARDTDGDVEVAEFLGLVLGFVEVADGAKAVGVAISRFGEQHVGRPQVFFDALETGGAGDGNAVRPGVVVALFP